MRFFIRILFTLLILFYIQQKVESASFLVDTRGFYVASSSGNKVSDSSLDDESTDVTSASADSSSSASSSSASDSFEDDDADDEDSAGLSKADIETRTKKCQLDSFLNANGSCTPCTRCGPNLYVLRACQDDRDTICDWCFSRAFVPNADFRTKCTNLVQVGIEVQQPIRRIEGSSSSSSESSSSEEEEEDQRRGDTAVKVSIDSSYWWKMEIVMEICFYIALIALILSIIRFLAKSKSYRTVHITAPVLDEFEHKNIVKAAESLRNKLGNKDYERLEEFI